MKGSGFPGIGPSKEQSRQWTYWRPGKPFDGCLNSGDGTRPLPLIYTLVGLSPVHTRRTWLFSVASLVG